MDSHVKTRRLLLGVVASAIVPAVVANWMHTHPFIAFAVPLSAAQATVGYLAMQDAYQEQRYGDRWAHTVVCKRSDVIPEQLRPDSRFVLALMLPVMADVAIRMTGLLILVSK